MHDLGAMRHQVKCINIAALFELIGIKMDQKRATLIRDKTRNIYLTGILIFTGIFTTISACVWFVSKLNF
jgi:uncharacterized membrane protein